MSFYDRPLIDTAAENSERSVNALRQHFQAANGFIAREDIPDKGCDFMMEIIAKKQSTNWRFPVQLKSIENPVTIQEGRYISYPFELSRLKYLLDYKPVVGLIVFYAVREDKFYFEYAEKIYYRLKDLHPDDAWQQQDKANIHIPIENELTTHARQRIHGRMMEIFARHHQMYQEQASGYSLPSIEPVQSAVNSKDLPERAAYTLRHQGMQLFQERKISFLDKLLSQVPNQVVVNNPEIAVIAAMTYCEMGKYIDAEYFLSKSLHKKDLPPFYIQSAAWTKIKNDYLLNKTDRQTYIERTKEFRNTLDPNDRANQILFDIKIITERLQGQSFTASIPPDIDKTILDLHADINKLNTDEGHKHNLKIMNAENFGLFMHRLTDHHLQKIQWLESKGHPNTTYFKQKSIEKITSFGKKFGNIINELVTTAQQMKDQYMEAQAITVLTRYTLGSEFAILFTQGINGSIAIDKTGKRLIDQFNNSILAGNHFIKAHQYIKAYCTFCNALEFLSIIRLCHHQLEFSDEELNANVEKLRDMLKLPEYELQAPLLIEQFNTNNATSGF
ncbi:DUF4365 domain-containing protein [Pseudoflavitalea sp. X16]|uniref:DUF4365 domain-containing protein n=1 Tax=Paraflavitalea devenefica TaxID=2716334 RepID=UPI0014248086|nr:DUF4365 domain-containing protein [Paraflavitalea devenefica]NII26114.1 DUF4365 domain-containing protein [Paraflavitalea devenefica]